MTEGKPETLRLVEQFFTKKTNVTSTSAMIVVYLIFVAINSINVLFCFVVLCIRFGSDSQTWAR